MNKRLITVFSILFLVSIPISVLYNRSNLRKLTEKEALQLVHALQKGPLQQEKTSEYISDILFKLPEIKKRLSHIYIWSFQGDFLHAEIYSHNKTLKEKLKKRFSLYKKRLPSAHLLQSQWQDGLAILNGPLQKSSTNKASFSFDIGLFSPKRSFWKDGVMPAFLIISLLILIRFIFIRLQLHKEINPLLEFLLSLFNFSKRNPKFYSYVGSEAISPAIPFVDKNHIRLEEHASLKATINLESIPQPVFIEDKNKLRLGKGKELVKRVLIDANKIKDADLNGFQRANADHSSLVNSNELLEDFSQKLQSKSNLEQVSRAIIENLFSLINSEEIKLYLRDNNSNLLYPIISKQASEIKSFFEKPNEAQLISEKSILYAQLKNSEQGFMAESHYWQPLHIHSVFIGALRIQFPKNSKNEFSSQKKLFEKMAHRASLSLFHFILFEMATFDSMTKIYSKRNFNRDLQQMHNRLLNREVNDVKMDAFLIILDIDHFKNINDRYGHDAGDEILINFGRELQKVSDQKRSIYRYGGEEFVILCEQENSQDVIRYWDNFREKIAETEWQIKNQSVKISISVGVAAFQKEEDSGKWFQNADEALLLAKRSGRNCLRVHGRQSEPEIRFFDHSRIDIDKKESLEKEIYPGL